MGSERQGLDFPCSNPLVNSRATQNNYYDRKPNHESIRQQIEDAKLLWHNGHKEVVHTHSMKGGVAWTDQATSCILIASRMILA